MSFWNTAIEGRTDTPVLPQCYLKLHYFHGWSSFNVDNAKSMIS